MSDIYYIVHAVPRFNTTSAPYEEREFPTSEAAWAAVLAFALTNSYKTIEMVKASRKDVWLENTVLLAHIDLPN